MASSAGGDAVMAPGAGASGGGGGYGGGYGRPTGQKVQVKAPRADEGESGPTNMKPGTRVHAKFRDGTERKAVVIERKAIKADDGSETGQFRYYLHWVDFNRRMDSWVGNDDVRYDAEGDAAAKAEERKRLQANRSAAAGGMPVVHPDGGKSGGKHGARGGHGGGAGGDAEEVVDEDESGTVFRGRKRKGDDTLVIDFVEPEHKTDGMSEDNIREHENLTKVKNVNTVELGKYRMEVWYFSPLPGEYWEKDGPIDTLHFCEFCLKFFRHKSELLNHCTKCRLRQPPGDEIYRGADGIGMFELDGAKEKQYCQNLCYLAKMFLDHKTLYHDVDLFLFYVMTEQDEHGFHIVGYYSKEKFSETGFNLACILTLPCHQRKGYGRFLIQFSYELSKLEGKIGHPERPLSDLGLLSYRSYWSWTLLGLVRSLPDDDISIMELMKRTSIRSEDIISTLQQLGMLRYWNGQHVIVSDSDMVEREYARQNSKPGPVVDAARIHWAPYRAAAAGKKDRFLISAKEAAAMEQ